MAPIISFSGIASGIDSSGLIKALLERERSSRIKPLETRITEYQDTNEALAKIKTLLSNLSSASDKFRTLRGGAIAKIASTGDETVATAVASNAAATGVYGISVSQVAKNATFSFGSSAEAYSSASAKISDGSSFNDTVSIKIGNPSDPVDTVDIEIDETTTLAQFVSQFNESTTKASASVVNVGTPDAPDYRVVINSNKTGTAEGAVEVTVGATLSGRNAFDSNSQDNARNAEFSIAGISGTITRSSNDVSDVIAGVTFSLKDIGSTTVTVGINASQSTAAVSDFVEAYNELVQYISANDLVTQEGSGNDKRSVFGSLARTSLDENIVSALRGAFSAASGSGGLANTLSDLGVTTQRDGTLAFDESVFNTALSGDTQGVAGVLERLGENLAGVSGTIAQFTRFNGLIDEATRGNTSQISSSQSRIADIERALEQQEAQLTQRFSRLEALIGRLNSQQSQLASLLPQ